ncbi:molybdenum cofactor guanylyltransferase [Abyssisolibacter fermentans]|uniref:molybdenum cofactor guanylyltransferase n=1 Tax=Abyssisolibacter fermentans TaxID=1766203 RepID=UPI00082D3633|nr:molybdenum cofactor guanylyltransferase [Abyssisolibacter fermentans]
MTVEYNIFRTCVILAGGKSLRMGFDKQFLKINNTNLIDNVINKLKYEFDDIVIITNKPNFYSKYNIRVFEDEIAGKGPLSGIHKGLKEAQSKYVYFTACDMPNINLNYIRYMKDIIKKENVHACITKYGNWIEPMNAFYNISILKNVEQYLINGNKAVYFLLKSLNCKYIEEAVAKKFSSNWNMFLNLNTKEDLKVYINEVK